MGSKRANAGSCNRLGCVPAAPGKRVNLEAVENGRIALYKSAVQSDQEIFSRAHPSISTAMDRLSSSRLTTTFSDLSLCLR